MEIKMRFLALVLLLVSGILDAAVLKVLWGWFVVTTFGLAVLSFPQALGLTALLLLFTSQHVPSKGKDMKDVEEMVAFSFFVPLTSLVLGLVAHLCM